jgi:hypothetical protein
MIGIYAFEVKSVQAWLFAGGKLRDAVGGSSLLDRLANWDGDDLVAVAAENSGLAAEQPDYLRRAGGGLIIRSNYIDILKRFRALWTLLVAREAPGLRFDDAIGTGSTVGEALAQARVHASESSGLLPDPVRGNPWTTLAPRTGRVALRELCKIVKGERQDAATQARRLYLDPSDDRVGAKFLAGRENDASEEYLWPNEMDPDDLTGDPNEVVFPLSSENRTVGLLHADANGLGQTLIKMQNEAAAGDLTTKFSRAVAHCVAEATRRACIEELLPYAESKGNKWVLPARPILLGGDDLTILLRGDRALPFAEAFLKAFAEETLAQMDRLRTTSNSTTINNLIPATLSAGAGIVYAKPRQPFAQVYLLCESLAKFAKSAAKEADQIRPPSLVAFHRLTTAAIPQTYGAVLTDELSRKSGRLTMNPYLVPTVGDDHRQPAHGFPRTSHLRDLADSFAEEGMARGPARRISAELLEADWEQPWKRLVEVAGKQGLPGFKEFCEAMKKLGCQDKEAVWPWGPVVAGQKQTPLLDALNLRSAEKGNYQRRDGTQ